MKRNYLKGKTGLISVLLLAVSVALVVLILAKVASFYVSTARAENLVESALTDSTPDANQVEQHLAESKAIADELKKKNLFAPPPPKQHPVKEVQGILGNEVIIKGKFYKIGEKFEDAKIVAIEPTRVKIEWDGKEKWFAPISAASPPAAKKEMKKGVEKKKEVIKKAGPTVAEPSEEVVVTVEEEDPLAWMGVTLSPRLREKFLERWNKASDEEKQQMKEQWSKVPDEQKQNIVDSMEEHIDEMP